MACAPYIRFVYPDMINLEFNPQAPRFFSFMSTDADGLNAYFHVLNFYEEINEAEIKFDFDLAPDQRARMKKKKQSDRKDEETLDEQLRRRKKGQQCKNRKAKVHTAEHIMQKTGISNERTMSALSQISIKKREQFPPRNINPSTEFDMTVSAPLVQHQFGFGRGKTRREDNQSIKKMEKQDEMEIGNIGVTGPLASFWLSYVHFNHWVVVAEGSRGKLRPWGNFIPFSKDLAEHVIYKNR